VQEVHAERARRFLHQRPNVNTRPKYLLRRAQVKPGSLTLTRRSVEWFRSRQGVPQDNDIFAQRFLP
jgi:hypothetical protein